MKLDSFKLERYFARYEFDAPYLLSSSDCEAMTIGELLSIEPQSRDQFYQQWLGYTESAGDPALREAITTLYRNIEAPQILVHSGAEEAIFNFMNSMLNLGDHIIIQYPCYQSLYEVARGIGCEVTRWEMYEADNWELDLNFLQKNIRPNTKAIVINSPHNPTGYLMSQTKFEQIVEIAREGNILLFSDEVYRFLEQNPADTLPAACDLYENAVSLGVMSKTFGLPGLRIGWIATRNSKIYEAMASFKDYLTICNSAPSEFLATLALRHKEEIIERNLKIAKDNIILLEEFFSRHRSFFNWITPKAGSIAFPSIKTNLDIEQLSSNLVQQKGVMLLPGSVYNWDDSKGSSNFRLGFGRKNLPEVINKFEEYLIENWH